MTSPSFFREYRGMTTMTATPGPWRTVNGDSVVHVVDGDGFPVASTTTKAFHEKHDATDKANARLIALAPEMAEALRWIAEIADANFEQDEKLRAQGARTLKRIGNKARALLTKIDGDA